jgi:hypothetical protein
MMVLSTLCSSHSPRVLISCGLCLTGHCRCFGPATYYGEYPK